MDEPLAEGREQVHVGAGTSSTLARHSHSPGISSEGSDVSLDPLQGLDLIEKAIVARSSAVIGAVKRDSARC
jgi:hypothetical protein